jgi:hypothetical protein
MSTTRERQDQDKQQRQRHNQPTAGNRHGDGRGDGQGDERGTNLRASPMMAHLLDALHQGQDIGHYGRLTFAMIARFFVPDDEIVRLLAKQPGENEDQAPALLLEVQAHDYNPPRRERILEWQARQRVPICPTPDDPRACNVYDELRFPASVYDHIEQFYEQQVEARQSSDFSNA